jgi:hypothetical protein
MAGDDGFILRPSYFRLSIQSEPRSRLSLTLPSSAPSRTLNRKLTPHSMINGNACFAYFNKNWGIPCRRRGRP